MASLFRVENALASSPMKRRPRSLRAVALALVIFGFLMLISPSGGILGMGAIGIGLSLYLMGYIGAKREWGFYPRALGIVFSVAVLIAVGALTNRALRHTNLPARARIAKAQADTRALASAVRDFSAHCGGLPVGGPNPTSGCTATTTAASGPAALPSVLLTRQTNAKKEVGGPFINSMPTLPAGWKGSGNSYSYFTFATGGFTVCATGDGTGANSDGGTTCP